MMFKMPNYLFYSLRQLRADDDEVWLVNEVFTSTSAFLFSAFINKSSAPISSHVLHDAR